MIQDSGIAERRKIREFTDLLAWQEAHKLVLQVYRITRRFPKEELFGLSSQMRRATISITSNIAEDFGRHGYKEKVQFYYLAQGSLTELKNQVIAGHDIGYLGVEDYGLLVEQLKVAHSLLQGLTSKTKTFLNHES
ncbi:MAG TPA: four helix bundle protein [Candidatus Paceibacterota bacterium]